ncbi:MAG TPA: glycosyltransferase [Candidatus Babeliales bacterium]|nr:glycosyltransferase [Candidatus Babeliales bacterium]
MLRKKTIIHIITSLKVGGAEALLVELIKSLQVKGYHNEVIYFHDGPNRQCLEQLGIKPIKISGFIKLYDPVFFMRLVRTVKQLNPHVIHSSLWSANVFARLVGKILNIPILCAIHSQTNLATVGTKNSRFRTFIDRCLANWAQRYVLVSSQMDGAGLPQDKVVTIQNGVQRYQLTTTKNLPQELNIEEDCFVVGTVGRFSPVKNYSLLLKAFAVFHGFYNNSVLLLVGQGELEQQLRDEAVQFGIMDKVRFIRSNQATEYYPLFHCFVMTSWQEGLSIALLEAMSVGVPPVIVKSDGEHEVVHSDNGILVDAYKPEILAASILRLAQNPEEQKKLGIAAARTIESEFSFSRMVEQYQREYDKLLDQ